MKIIYKRNPVGDFVKLLFNPNKIDPKLARSERMWVIITENLGNGKWKGILDNEPMNLISVKIGDVIEFHQDDMIDFFDKKTNFSNKNIPDIPFEQRAIAEPLSFRHTYHPDYQKFNKIALSVDEVWDETFLKEELVVEFVGSREYKIKCIPLCKKGLSYNDTLQFIENDRYNIIDGGYRNILIKFTTNNFEILSKYKNLMIYEQNAEKAFSIAYLREDEAKLEELFQILSNEELYTYYVFK